MPKTDASKSTEKKPALLAHVAKRYEVAMPHVAAELAAYPDRLSPAEPLAEGALPAEPSPIDLYKQALMAVMVQLDAALAAKMMPADAVVARQRDLVQMMAEVTAKPAK